MDGNPNNEILEMLKKHYKVVKNSDGSYTVHTGSGTYSLKAITDNDPFKPAITEGREKKTINPFGNIGEDDINPNINPKLGKKGKIRGMFPEENDSSSDSNPQIGIDPIYPSKGKKRGPEPDPDHEYFGGDMYYSKK